MYEDQLHTGHTSAVSFRAYEVVYTVARRC